MEKFDIDIVHCLKMQHGYVDGLIRAYKGVGDVLVDDDFPNVAIMTINAKNKMKNTKKYSIFGWHEVSNWSYKGNTNVNCA
jgi:hypothetical protein